MSNTTDNNDFHPKPKVIDTDNTDVNTSALKTDENTDLMFDRFADPGKQKKETVNPIDKNSTYDTSSTSSSSRSRSSTNSRSYTKTETNKKSSFSGSYGNEKTRQETEDELHHKKFRMLIKLAELEQYGVKLSKRYNMNDSFKSMEDEYNAHVSIRAKKEAVEMCSGFLIGCAKGIEMLNENYNPFDMSLEGYQKRISSNITSYYEVLGELYEKYAGPAKKHAPELRLLFMLGGSAAMVVGENKMASLVANNSPNINNELSSNPALKEKLRQKAMENRHNSVTERDMTNINNYYEQEHAKAAQKAREMERIEQFKRDYAKKQEFLNAQNQLNKLNKTKFTAPVTGKTVLVEPISQSVPVMKPVIRPAGMMGNITSPNDVNNKTAYEQHRQNEILQHKMKMSMQQENISRGRTVTTSIGDLVNTDQVSSITTIDGDDVSNNSKVILRRKRRKKKSNIKVNTD